MNRIILVGNGFDLAHNLRTGYRDFIDDFWVNISKTLINSENKNRTYFKDDVIEIQNKSGVDLSYLSRCEIKNYESFKDELKAYYFSHTIHNRFFNHLNSHRSINNWVDIEHEYYQLLDDCKDSEYSIEDLNKDFDIIKILFIDYLKRIDLHISKSENIKRIIRQRYYLREFVQTSQVKILNEVKKTLNFTFEKMELNINLSPESFNFQKKYLDYINEADNELEISKFLKTKTDDLYTDSSIEILKLRPENTLFLNFNYTNTLDYYTNRHYDETISIHGELRNEENPIIFGFGDDVHEKYREFENLNDNRYLKNFKSIAYLQTDNYKKLLEFLDLEEYQVFIFGHSCGISDRTMLNTIFEHDNCKSIKPFYHRKKDDNGNYITDEKGNFIDNYTELVQNISRNFNNKKKFRDKVVNKTYCEPLT